MLGFLCIHIFGASHRVCGGELCDVPQVFMSALDTWTVRLHNGATAVFTQGHTSGCDGVCAVVQVLSCSVRSSQTHVWGANVDHVASLCFFHQSSHYD